jgi:hypothetical protein
VSSQNDFAVCVQEICSPEGDVCVCVGSESQQERYLDCVQGYGAAREQADLYSLEYDKFANDADQKAMNQLAHALQHANLCNSEHFVLIGGVNKGKLAERLLQRCIVFLFLNNTQCQTHHKAS